MESSWNDHKIVTLSRYLYQHARPMSEVIQNPGSGFPQRESRTDKAQQASLTGTQVETRDKQEGGDVDMTTATDKKESRGARANGLPSAITSTHHVQNQCGTLAKE